MPHARYARSISATRYCDIDTKGLLRVLLCGYCSGRSTIEEVLKYWGITGSATPERLEQTQLARTRDGLGATLHLEFVEDVAIVPFDRAQGEEQPRANLAIRESLGNQV